jgi:aerobic carbon-monoxide dehydrogenase large subunit
MLHAAFVRSPVARGALARVDVAAARAMPGVAAVTPPLRPLADGDVRFAGDPIAIVVAQSRYLAEDAAEAVEVDLEPLEPVLQAQTGLDTEILVHPETGSNLAAQISSPADDEQTFAGAAHVVTETVTQHRYVAVPMEGRGLVASWEPGRGELTNR